MKEGFFGVSLGAKSVSSVFLRGSFRVFAPFGFAVDIGDGTFLESKILEAFLNLFFYFLSIYYVGISKKIEESFLRISIT